jgi:hypothetical protein
MMVDSHKGMDEAGLFESFLRSHKEDVPVIVES